MLDIVVPVYNEADNIIKLFNEIEKEIHTEKIVFIIYDFDKDNTLPVVKKNIDKYSFKIFMIKNKIGKGVLNAIKTGITATENDKVLIMMADLSDKLNVVDRMEQMLNQGYDLVCGSRYMKGGKQNGGPIFKSLLSRFAGLTLHLFTQIPTHDVTNSFKMYSRKVLNSISIESTGGFEIGIEITVKAYIKGFRIGEIPSEWNDRENGKSNFLLWKWLPKYIKWYLYCMYKTSMGFKKGLKK